MKTYAEMQKNVWTVAEKAIMHGRRVLLYGPPGTGKTTAAVKVGAPPIVYTITLTEDTPAAEIRGHYLPGEHGSWVWQDGPGISAWNNGVRLVINEIDHGSGDVHSLLHALLDDKDTAQLMLPNGDIITPEPGFQVIATMNGVPEDLPTALQDRFETPLLIDQPHPNAIASLPADLQAAAKATVGIADPERRQSIRAWHNYAYLRTVLSVDEALFAVFGKACREVGDALSIGTVAADKASKATV